MKLKNLVMALALPPLLAGGLFAADESAPLRMRIDFGGQQAEVQMNAGEPVQLRNRETGELLVVRAMPEPGTTPRARVEVTRSSGKTLAEPSEQFELTVGEIGKTRNLSSKVELELLSVPAVAPTTQAKPDLFQVNLELPGGRTVMAVGDVRPDEMVRLRDRGTGVSLGFRPSFTKAGKPSDIEIFSFDTKAKGGGSYRFLARVPVGGEFSVPAEKVGLPDSGGTTLKIKGSIVPPMAGMWEESAFSGGATEPVFLRARWDGGPWIDGVNYDGHLFRIEVPGVAGEIGIAAAAANGRSDERNLSVFQVQKVQGSGETLKQLDTMMAREDQPVRVSGLDGRLELQLLSHRARNLKKGACWLGCGGGVSAHGCGVSCGGTDCCIGVCCEI
jgi:hypothetical protein